MNSQFVDINLLPRPVRAAVGGAAWARLMVPGLILLFLATLLVLVATLLKVRNDRLLAEQRIRLEQTREDIRDLNAVQTEQELLEQQVTDLATQAQQLEGDAERIATNNPPLAPFLQALYSALLPRMEITSIEAEPNNTFIVEGEAGSDALVVAYIQALSDEPGISTVTPLEIEELSDTAAPGAVRWTLQVTRLP